MACRRQRRQHQTIQALFRATRQIPRHGAGQCGPDCIVRGEKEDLRVKRRLTARSWRAGMSWHRSIRFFSSKEPLWISCLLTNKGVQLCATIRRFDALEKLNHKKKLDGLVLAVGFSFEGKPEMRINMPKLVLVRRLCPLDIPALNADIRC